MFKKMAVVRDEADQTEELSEYVISDESEAVSETPKVKVLSISEKIQMAMRLAQKVKSASESKKEKEEKIYENGGQISIYEMMELAG